ncbi:MAG: tetraacyldisaccharide 4'-kinase [Alphaproteobacteria bacterium]|nr:tetraacyldisaccharide 4'-kinase [Alphaproteobacteria bacterium]
MKTPTYWKKKGIISFILLPIGVLYALITRIRTKLIKGKAVGVPVVCIGNLTAGGTGKTPIAISLAKAIQNKGYNPFFISRGYGGKLKGIIVDPQKHTAHDVGDEPLLLSRQAPVSINSDRVKAAELAIQNGADFLIMDDGFQNPWLKKDISFVVVDGVFGFGNRRPIPSGPLREFYAPALRRADAVIMVGEDEKRLERKIHKPIFKAFLKPLAQDFKNKKIFAFAGIGRPEKFYQSLKNLGADVVKTIDFPDHHFYSEKELQQIITDAENLGAEVYTTSKDFVKIPVAFQKSFNVLEIEVAWEKESYIENFIFEKLKKIK